MKRIEMVGRRFSHLVVVGFAPSTKTNQIQWKCICDCGNFAVVRGVSLRSGMTKSCGCARAISNSNRLTTHGMRGSEEYRIWRHIRTRCENENSPSYANYGGRGIHVCARWMEFSNFLSDMGIRPSPNHSIDRIDNNQGYEPGNCRWATWKQQQRNRRNNRIYTVGGITAALAEHCECAGVKYTTVYQRLLCGLDINTALTPGNLRG